MKNKYILLFLPVVFFVVIWITLVVFLGLRRTKMIGTAMEPTVKNGAQIIYQNIQNTSVQKNDIVVYKSVSGNGSIYLDRIIGFPHDTIMINDDGVYLNNKLLNESYLSSNAKTNLWENGFVKTNEPVLVPENYYFIMGDNREHSNDSRAVGFIPKENIVGKYLFAY